MKKLRNFKCGTCRKEYEQFVEDAVDTFPCQCGKDAVKQISSPKYFGNSTGKSPAAK